jgi:hypothetical protein
MIIYNIGLEKLLTLYLINPNKHSKRQNFIIILQKKPEEPGRLFNKPMSYTNRDEKIIHNHISGPVRQL